ncbi:hypothetical protein [Alteromonas gilva]|uniref:Solute-binding protein family 3/N-terminal domain-containing protein n=1 Tax=Alteromonas gilva TaxID=2987522 RepID=A0ABT5L1Y3_9ALTE|nr:hypothetical protein [Alteromonas gilva]MDC8830424.1 hypothetical protein [Alteromonas gilva]
MRNYFFVILSVLRPYMLRCSALLMLTVCFHVHADLHSIIDSAALNVGVINDEHHHRFLKSGHAGTDASLARGFADYLGVKLTIVPFYTEQALMQALAQGRIHIAAPRFSGLADDEAVVAGPAFFSSPLAIVHRRDSQKGCLNAPPQQRLIKQALVPTARATTQLDWHSSSMVDTPALLDAITNNKSECTLLPKAFFNEVSKDYPTLTTTPLPDTASETAPSGTVTMTKRWLLLPQDVALRSSLFEYTHLNRQHYAISNKPDTSQHEPHKPDSSSVSDFVMAVENKLSHLHEEFKHETTVLPWQVIVAIDYIESQWRNDKTLTSAETGPQRQQRITVINRQLEELNQQLPARITGVDRDWLLIAAYHCGLAHIEDARQLTMQAGSNPDLWINIKQQLSRLSLPAYYHQSQYGYTNGKQTLQFVDTVRLFADSLQVMNSGEQADNAR